MLCFEGLKWQKYAHLVLFFILYHPFRTENSKLVLFFFFIQLESGNFNNHINVTINSTKMIERLNYWLYFYISQTQNYYLTHWVRRRVIYSCTYYETLRQNQFLLRGPCTKTTYRTNFHAYCDYQHNHSWNIATANKHLYSFHVRGVKRNNLMKGFVPT